MKKKRKLRIVKRPSGIGVDSYVIQSRGLWKGGDVRDRNGIHGGALTLALAVDKLKFFDNTLPKEEVVYEN